MSILHNCIPLAKMQMANQAKQFSYSDLMKYYIHAIQKDNSVPEQDFIIKLIGKLIFYPVCRKKCTHDDHNFNLFTMICIKLDCNLYI